MVRLFAFEFIEGNTITRLYFMRMRRLTRTALAAGPVTPELTRARGEVVPTFTHFLDLPVLFLIIALGAMQPATWTFFFHRFACRDCDCNGSVHSHSPALSVEFREIAGLNRVRSGSRRTPGLFRASPLCVGISRWTRQGAFQKVGGHIIGVWWPQWFRLFPPPPCFEGSTGILSLAASRRLNQRLPA
jgi:hypothetical protein